MSRQVCRLLEVLAVELRGNFNGLALHFVGDLLKVLVITVQVCRPRRSGRSTYTRHTRRCQTLPSNSAPEPASRVRLR